MAKDKQKENWYIIGAAVAAWALWAWYQKKKMQPQTKPAEKRFLDSSVNVETTSLLDQQPQQRQSQKPQFPYVVEIKSISGLKMM